METALKCKVGLSEIKEVLKQMNFVFVGKRNTKKLINCKITLKDGMMEFDAHGFTFNLKAKSKGGVEFQIPFPRLQIIINTAKDSFVVFIIRDGVVQINNTCLNITTTFFRNSSPIKKIALSVNSNDRELLLLPHLGYTQTELNFNKLTPKIKRAKARLEDRIVETYSILEVYGVTLDDIEELVHLKLYGKINK